MDFSRPMRPRPAAHFRNVERRRAGGRLWWMAAALLIGAAGIYCFGAQHPAAPSISGNLGPCTADFIVTDSSDKPIYNAKIHVTVLYGFMNKRKMDLEIGTDSDGKARFEGLPDKLKKPPMEFTVRSGDLSKSVRHDPAVDCHPSFTVALGKS